MVCAAVSSKHHLAEGAWRQVPSLVAYSCSDMFASFLELSGTCSKNHLLGPSIDTVHQWSYISKLVETCSEPLPQQIFGVKSTSVVFSCCRLNQFLVTPLGLLLTFRTQQSITRFNGAVDLWSKVSSACRTLSRALFYQDARIPLASWLWQWSLRLSDLSLDDGSWPRVLGPKPVAECKWGLSKIMVPENALTPRFLSRPFAPQQNRDVRLWSGFRLGL